MIVKSCYEYFDGKIEKLSVGEFKETQQESRLLNVYSLKKAEWLGFGGAFTDSSSYCYSLLKTEDKQKVLEGLFGESGLKYNFCRLCIGSSDFALEEYCYVEDNDYDLKTFSIERDKKYIIPFIKDAIKYSKREIYLFASPWAPPAFMKETNNRFFGGKLRKDCYKLFAEYIVKFLQAYREEGILISALTLQNEPKAAQTWESCFYTAEDEIEFAICLRQVLDKNGFEFIKLLCWDHNKERLFDRADKIFTACPNVVDGVGFHWYSGEHFDAIGAVRAKYPDKLILETEFCKSVIEGTLYKRYCNEILGDIKQGANGICDWNMVLNEIGGPHHNRNDHGGCEAPIRIDSNTLSVQKSEIYYDTFMFANFIERGAKILYTSTYNDKVKICAVENPNGEIVVNVFNDMEDVNAMLYINGKGLELNLKAKALYTIVLGN